MKNNIVIDCDIRIIDIEDLLEDKPLKIPSNKIFDLIVRYPLEDPVSFKIETSSNGMTYLEFLQKIFDAYLEIYGNPTKYKVYGHVMSDLFLERIDINLNNNTINIVVGS